MAVKINYFVDDSKMIKFKHLDIGDTFVYCDRLYMKIPTVENVSIRAKGNAILAMNGKLIHMMDDSEVRVVDVEMRVIL